jgi:WD40 repeat protein
VNSRAGPVAIAPDGKRVVGVGDRDVLRVWAMPDGAVKGYDGIGGPTAAVAWLADGKRFVVAPADPKEDLHVFDPSTGRRSGQFPSLADAVEGPLVASADGKWLAAGVRSGGVGWWEVGSRKAVGVAPRALQNGGVDALAFPPTHRVARVFGPGWGVSDLPAGGLKAGRVNWDTDAGVPHVAAVSPDGAFTAVGTKGGELHLLPEQGRAAHVWPLPGRPTAVAFSATGRYLAVAHPDGGIGVYRLP